MTFLWGLLGLIALIALYMAYGRAKKLKSDEKFCDRAIQELQALEASELNDQEAYKQYYSSLTAIVRTILRGKRQCFGKHNNRVD